MNYSIEEKEELRIVGVKKWFSTVNNEQFEGIPTMWTILSELTMNQMRELSITGEIIGLCADMYDNGFDYWIGAITKEQCPENMYEKVIPASTWAVFEVIGPLPHAMQEVWGKIYSEWLPTTGYKHAELPEVEYYSNGDKASESYKSGIWIPIIKG